MPETATLLGTASLLGATLPTLARHRRRGRRRAQVRVLSHTITRFRRPQRHRALMEAAGVGQQVSAEERVVVVPTTAAVAMAVVVVVVVCATERNPSTVNATQCPYKCVCVCVW